MKTTQALRHPSRGRGVGIRQVTAGDVASRQVPVLLVRNIRRGHLIGGMRDIAHIGWKSWEQSVAEMQRVQERRIHNKANRFHKALRSARTRLGHVERRKEALQAIHEEMTAAHRKLQATHRELQSAHKALHARSEELRQADANARARFNAAPAPLMAVGRNGKIIDANAEAEAMIGIVGEDLAGSNFSSCFTDPGHARALCHNALKVGSVRNAHLELRHVDGHVTPVMCSAVAYQDDAGKAQGLFVELRDISEQRQLELKVSELMEHLKGSESQLAQLDRLSGVGAISADLARELGEPMMAILNSVRHCLKQTGKGDEQYPLLQEIEQETQRCIGMVHSLSLVSRMEGEGGEDYEKESCTVICDRVIDFLFYRAGKEKASIKRHAARGTPRIWMKPNEIQQVISNLISNALDGVEETRKKEITVDIRRKGGFLQLTISDTGCGIPPEQIEKVFEPFCTTKPTGQGTGLGLFISRSIVESHGGKIVCDSEAGKGTAVKVLLPIEKRKP